ncbi:MAG: 30S ribosome-binding factor RbfA [Desulfosarcinaceae bacterium]|nr:30S ribosome-binding factor RbfA [Desulfosarcinaceae bacterium]
MKPYSRSERVSGQIHKQLSELLQKRISDPRLASTTISGVKMTSDLRIAKIYFATGDGGQRKTNALEGFKSARGFLKRTLAARLGLRYMPDLQFYYDDSFDYGARIEAVFKRLEAEHGSDRSSTEKE